ncbi:hypothetical protein FACS1894126_2450 [Alphaproteobacteria bacterium]|nr:hypothetical protein FACS1894126_2450 [Alphaproteobacteria bacterium]
MYSDEAYVCEVVCDVNYASMLYGRLSAVDSLENDLLNVLNSENSSSVALVGGAKGKKAATLKSEHSKKTDDPIEVVKTGEFAGAKVVKSCIKSNFYVDARRLGVPAKVVDAVVKNMSSKIDFRRSLKVGDSFEILYDKKNDLLYSKIATKRKEIALYRFPDGKTSSYFFANGEKVQQPSSNSTSFGAPLLGKLVISDHFGRRMHPITRKYHIHTGVDFRAPYGSPVCAIYDGVVTRASHYQGYGKCVDICHTNGYSSRYGHLSKYAVKCGAKVKKGQIIAYIGSSGISTGPHVHLELARNNMPMDPLKVKMMPTNTEKQGVSNKKAFRSFVSRIDSIIKSKRRSA